jgi:hypothetical protein
MKVIGAASCLDADRFQTLRLHSIRKAIRRDGRGTLGRHGKELPHDLGTRRGSREAAAEVPLCGGTEFDQQQGRMDSRWGITSHKLVLQICRRCGLVLQFSAGRGIFDFD